MLDGLRWHTHSSLSFDLRFPASTCFRGLDVPSLINAPFVYLAALFSVLISEDPPNTVVDDVLW